MSRDKLLSIGWFAKGYWLVIAVRDRVHLYLEGTRWWPVVVGILGRAREGWRALKARIGTMLGRASAALRRLAGANPPSAP